MKKNIGNALALYPTPLVVVGAMVNGKPNWLLVGYLGTIDHTYAEEAVLTPEGKVNYHALKPVLFEMPTYEYLRTGDVIGKCMSFGKEKKN